MQPVKGLWVQGVKVAKLFAHLSDHRAGKQSLLGILVVQNRSLAGTLGAIQSFKEK